MNAEMESEADKDIAEQAREEYLKLYDEAEDKRLVFDVLVQIFIEVLAEQSRLLNENEILKRDMMIFLGANENNKEFRHAKFEETMQSAKTIMGLQALKKAILEQWAKDNNAAKRRKHANKGESEANGK